MLYYIGELRSFEEAVAVVGARRCTAYGKNVTKALASELATNKIPVLSGLGGLAKGIETACLNENGYTIAFVASGVNVCYPKEHRSLYEQIKATGTIISKFKPKYFLDRYGLMSAFATKVVIVEAGERSGSLSTAEFANKQGKNSLPFPTRSTRLQV